jgi:ParB-like chromosome segregation protein Spo0J
MLISELKFGNNMREINENEVIKMMDSINQVGLLSPLGIDGDNNVIYGRHRLEALIRLGFTNVPCVIVKSEKPEQITKEEFIKLLQIEENLVRFELTPIEKAKAIKDKKEILEKIHGSTKNAIEKIQDDLDISKGNIYKNVKIAEGIPDEIIDDDVKEMNLKELETIAVAVDKELAKQEIIQEKQTEKTPKTEPKYLTYLKGLQSQLTLSFEKLNKEVDHKTPKKILKIVQEEMPSIQNQIKSIIDKIERLLPNEEESE